jgi:Type IV secretory pathway, VirB10 components
MSEYDEETGLVLSDEDEIVKEASIEEKEDQSSDTPEETEPEEKKQKAPRINKKLLLMIAAGLVSTLVIVSLIHPGEKKAKSKDDAIASEISVPDFSTTRRIYEAPEETPAEPEKTPQPVYMAPPRQTQQEPPPKEVVSNTVSGPDESELRAYSAPMIPAVQGRLLGQQVQASYSLDQGGSNPVGKAMSALGNMGQDEYTASRLSALGGLGGGEAAGSGLSNNGNNYHEQNMQDNKQTFYDSGRDDDVTGEFIGSDTLWNGSVIPGVLITGINTDLPGDIQARVTENIHDSLTGEKLLIPQGSILIASYNSSVSFAQSRVQIAWNTLIRPDGFQISLGNMNGIDAQGYSGTKGRVDEHIFQYVKAAGIISAFTILNGEFAASMAGTTNDSLKGILAANQGVVNQMSEHIIERTLDVQPTLRVKSGTKINIMLNKNIRLPPIEDYPVTSAYKRK